jgi:hypothetical protein
MRATRTYLRHDAWSAQFARRGAQTPAHPFQDLPLAPRLQMVTADSKQREIVSHFESTSGRSVTQVRGALVVSSLQTLRELNYLDRYLSHLPKHQAEQVLYVLASSWLPVDLALAHYGACEAMDLTTTELEAIGQHVSARIMGTFLGTLMRTSRQVGAGTTPLVPLRQYSRLWERLLVGGGCTVLSSGMKDASIESRGIPMLRYRYFRIAYMGLIRGAGLMFAKAVYTRIGRASDDAMTIEASWV